MENIWYSVPLISKICQKFIKILFILFMWRGIVGRTSLRTATMHNITKLSFSTLKLAALKVRRIQKNQNGITRWHVARHLMGHPCRQRPTFQVAAALGARCRIVCYVMHDGGGGGIGSGAVAIRGGGFVRVGVRRRRRAARRRRRCLPPD